MSARQETRNTIAHAVISMNDARFDGLITRETHAIRVKEIDDQLMSLGLTWDDVDADIRRIERDH
jgi:hypothetical protein